MFIGLFRSTNDYWKILFSYKCAHYRSLLDVNKGTMNEPFPPYLISDKGHFLMSWIMAPFKEEGQHSILELLYNCNISVAN